MTKGVEMRRKSKSKEKKVVKKEEKSAPVVSKKFGVEPTGQKFGEKPLPKFGGTDAVAGE